MLCLSSLTTQGSKQYADVNTFYRVKIYLRQFLGAVSTMSLRLSQQTKEFSILTKVVGWLTAACMLFCVGVAARYKNTC